MGGLQNASIPPLGFGSSSARSSFVRHEAKISTVFVWAIALRSSARELEDLPFDVALRLDGDAIDRENDVATDSDLALPMDTIWSPLNHGYVRCGGSLDPAGAEMSSRASVATRAVASAGSRR
jgi:hypothetical protein